MKIQPNAGNLTSTLIAARREISRVKFALISYSTFRTVIACPNLFISVREWKREKTLSSKLKAWQKLSCIYIILYVGIWLVLLFADFAKGYGYLHAFFMNCFRVSYFSSLWTSSRALGGMETGNNLLLKCFSIIKFNHLLAGYSRGLLSY